MRVSKLGPRRRAPEGFKAIVLAAGCVAIAGLAVGVMLRTAAMNPIPLAAPGDMVAMQGLGRTATVVTVMPVADVWAPPGPACQLDIAALAARRAVLVVAAVRGGDILLRLPPGAGCGALVRLTGVAFEQLTMVEGTHPG